MSSNSRMTRSKGPTEELSLPPTRMRKDVPTTNEGKEDAPEAQANVQSQQRTADTPSPFARPGSRAGTSTTPASETGMLPAASTLFARPDSRAGLAPQKPTSPQSSLSSTRDQQMQEDENTSVSWDLVDTDTDAEVANINLAPTHQTVTNQNCVDSTNKMQNNAVGLNHELNTLYNQDFFVADTTGRRLSQVVDKSNYSPLLPNGNAALQLRLPDLLIYLKTDTYLVDVKTGHHYAVYHSRFEKYFDNKETTKTTPKVQINSATLQVMGQTAKDCGYTKDEFIRAVEMYEHFGNINLEDVPAPSPQD